MSDFGHAFTFMGDNASLLWHKALETLALSGAVLASSFLRLRLYQDAYGWTELRFYVLASIGFLALAFLGTAPRGGPHG